jgi:uncharacterized iron-regulated protein
MKSKYWLIGLIFLLGSMSGGKPSYQLYTVNGKKTTYERLLKDALSCKVILFGELHNNPIAHWLELQLTKDIYKVKKQKLILGAEMFEADNQEAIDKYFRGEVVEDTFRKLARFWPNYATDYKPLLEFGRNANLKFIATNVPRKYASLVYKRGFTALDSLPGDVRKYMAPLPIDYDAGLDCYKKMLEMGGMGQMGTGHASPNLPKAQAIKDATMAYFIRKNTSDSTIFLHYNGSFHSDYFEGIMWYLKRADPYMEVLTIATVEQSDLSKLSEDYILMADYILVIPDDMTKTYE